jgi:WhiB family transcriptional regulator, redox-sensing transcriptional regulator
MTSWRDEARCGDVDPELFFADKDSGSVLRRMRTVAAENCLGCPSLERCAEYADDRREVGLWAGAYRTDRLGPYMRRPLIPGAPLFELGPKVAEAAVWTWIA